MLQLSVDPQAQMVHEVPYKKNTYSQNIICSLAVYLNILQLTCTWTGGFTDDFI